MPKDCAFGAQRCVPLSAYVRSAVVKGCARRVGRRGWGLASGAIIASTLVCVCGAVSRCFAWLVLSLLAACGSHVLPVGAVALLGFR